MSKQLFAQRIDPDLIYLAIAPLVIARSRCWVYARGVARPFAILGFCAAGTMALAPLFENTLQRVLAALLVSPRVRARASAALTQIVHGIRAFHDRSRVLGFVGLTILIWFLDATAAIVGARGLSLRFSYSTALLLTAGLGFGSALPSTPGYLGIYQFVAVTVLVPFGLTRTEAIAYILVAQAVSYAVIGCWGAIGLWQFTANRSNTPKG